jgi:UDP-N-acetylglucosamine 1-carboxyvinyltransferase
MFSSTRIITTTNANSIITIREGRVKRRRIKTRTRMAVFEVTGGNRLQGEITPQGAKNEALQVISAVLLTSGKVIIHNIPDILDVNNLISLLKDLGVTVEKLSAGSYSFQADHVDLKVLASDAFQKKSASLRGSIMMVGPLLARFGKAYIARPGGDKIGRRRLDTHFIGFEKLGAKFG